MTDPEVLVGRNAMRTFTVSEQDLAPALGSGDVPVLATPRMIAWLEAATVAAVADVLPAGSTTVGTAVEVDHVAAVPAGAVVIASATVRSFHGRTLVFDCEAATTGAGGTTLIVGHGAITRAVVDREKFASRIAKP